MVELSFLELVFWTLSIILILTKNKLHLETGIHPNIYNCNDTLLSQIFAFNSHY